jgi:type I restriction enzyme, S subunit
VTAGWTIKKLGDLCVVDKRKHDLTPKPYVGLEDIESQTGVHLGSLDAASVKSLTFSFDQSHLLYGRLRPYLNKVLLPDFEGHCSTEIFPIRPLPPLDRRFLYYWITQQRVVEAIDATCTGARMPRADVADILDFDFALPPLEEQRRIVAVLDEAFAGIATATANAQKNLTNARALFESYLEATIDGNGQSWTEATLGKICSFHGGAQPPKSTFQAVPSPESIRFIQIRDYKSDNHLVYIPKNLAKRFCSATDVMIGRYGPPLFQILRGIEGAYNVALIKALPNEILISKDYLYFFLRNRSILKYIVDSSARAAGQIGLNKETIEPYPIRYPSLEQQAELVSKLELAEQKAVELEGLYQSKVTTLAELKQSLLQKAFAGELT